MKKVIVTPSVEVALRTLDEANRRRISSWFDRLANWDSDESVRRHSHSLESVPGAHVLKTSTDFRLFFTVQEKTITIIDIAKRQSILASGADGEAE